MKIKIKLFFGIILVEQLLSLVKHGKFTGRIEDVNNFLILFLLY